MEQRIMAKKEGSESTVPSTYDWSAPAEVLKAMGHPLRLQIIAILCRGDMCVTDLMDRLGVPQPTVSQHLRLLRMNGLVDFTREGGFKRYRLVKKGLPDLVRCLIRCDCDPNERM